MNLPLLLSILVLAAGVAAFVGRHRLRAAPGSGYLPLGNADRIYDAVIRGTDVFAVRLTALTQRGSIPATQAVILSTLVLLPIAMLVLGARDRPAPRAVGLAAAVVVGLIILAAALSATMLRNRLAAVLLVGVTGYGCGAIFVFHGAPDLALTQFLVETLTLVIFVLVLRTLPAEADRANITRQSLAAHRLVARRRRQRHRAGGVRDGGADHPAAWPNCCPTPPTTAGTAPTRSTCCWSTSAPGTPWARSSVLLVAATGVASMVFRNRRFGAAPRVADAGQPDIGPVVGRQERSGREMAPCCRPARRSATSPGCAAASSAIRATGRWSSRSRRASSSRCIMVLSFYFFFAGHNTPGGGFAGGLTAGLALVLRYLAGGRYELGEALPVDAGKVLGAGLSLSAGTAVASLLLGAPVLSSAVVQLDVPVLGHVKLVTALFFDLGVYLIVVGLVLDVLRSLGARVDVEMAEQTQGVRR